MSNGAHELILKYPDIAPAAIDRIWRSAQTRFPKSAKEAQSAARRALHQMTGAFMTGKELRAARKPMARYLEGDRGALGEALRMHASTRERLDSAEALYGELFAACGRPALILDLACGLNPLYLGDQGFSVRGLDVHGGLTALVGEWADQCGWDVRAACADLLSKPPMPECELALLFKLLPLLERQEKGAAMALLTAVPCRYRAVTFPTRTLSGRGVGMEKNYSEWFESNLPDSLAIVKRFIAGDELCYLVEEVPTCQSYTSSPRRSAISARCPSARRWR